MTREQPPRGSAEWHEQREILKLVHQSWLADVDAQIVQPLVAVDTPRVYRILDEFHNTVIVPAERYALTEALANLRAFMRKHRAVRVHFQRALDTNVLPYLRTLAAYQEYYDLYGDES